MSCGSLPTRLVSSWSRIPRLGTEHADQRTCLFRTFLRTSGTLMATLDEFLKAVDLDHLLKVRHGLGQVSSEESERISLIVSEWRDGQAISNLLFYPRLIPATQRWEALDRALDENGHGYYIIAALVGLQSVEPASV